MNCERMESLLDGYLDGELDVAERAEVERHLAACGDCHRLLAELKGLKRAAGELPRELSPDRDLWPGIRATIERGDDVRDRAAGTPASHAWLRWAGLAASVLIVVLAALAGARWLRPEATAPITALPAAAPGAELVLEEFRNAESQYEQASRTLLEVLEERKGELSPETFAAIEENLRIIDQAIDEVRAALEADPGNAQNGRVLNALYQQKVGFLWNVTRLSS